MGELAVAWGEGRGAWREGVEESDTWVHGGWCWATKVAGSVATPASIQQ